MKRSAFMLLIVLAASGSLAGGNDRVPVFGDYESMRARFGALFAERKYAEAGAVLEAHMAVFPDHRQANAFNLACVHVLLAEYDEAVRVLDRAADLGIWYGKYNIEDELLAPLSGMSTFQQYLVRNNAMRRAATPGRVLVDVDLPRGYDPEREYPLFLAMHGADGSNADFKRFWHSPRLAREFVLAYVQSSVPSNMQGFSWYVLEEILADVMSAFGRIDADYAIDRDRIYVGGYSSGAVAALCMAFDSALPVEGYLCLGPPMPRGSLTVENIGKAAGRGLRGAAIIGEKDPFLPGARAIAATFDSLGHDFTMQIVPDTGHEYPEDLPMRIDAALADIIVDSNRP